MTVFRRRGQWAEWMRPFRAPFLHLQNKNRGVFALGVHVGNSRGGTGHAVGQPAGVAGVAAMVWSCGHIERTSRLPQTTVLSSEKSKRLPDEMSSRRPLTHTVLCDPRSAMGRVSENRLPAPTDTLVGGDRESRLWRLQSHSRGLSPSPPPARPLTLHPSVLYSYAHPSSTSPHWSTLHHHTHKGARKEGRGRRRGRERREGENMTISVHR